MKTGVINYQLLAALLPLALGACTYQPVAEKGNSITAVDVTHGIVFNDGQETLSTAELSSLDQFLDPIPLSAVSQIFIESSDTGALTRKRERRLEKLLMHHGAAPSAISRGITPGGMSSMMTLHLHYTKAVTSACPDWSKSSIQNYDNTQMSNWGCSTAVNMGKMAMDPEDLVRGHGNDTPDAGRDSMALQKYSGSASSGQTAATGASGSAGGTGTGSSGSAPASGASAGSSGGK